MGYIDEDRIKDVERTTVILRTIVKMVGGTYEVSKLSSFRFYWCDAWYSKGWGYDAILTSGEKGTWIDVLVDGIPERINISDREDEFIDDLKNCKIFQWNEKYYVNPNVLDGYMWGLTLSFDSNYIKTRGSNGYPPQFELFLLILHNKWGLSKAKIDSQKGFSITMESIDTEAKEYDEWF
jgi:hypothetical protein